jgi:uncharacterized protein YbcI
MPDRAMEAGMGESTQVSAVGERSPLAAVTRGVVRLHAEYFGKGPTRARTDRIGEDGLICVLRDTLTPVELTLIERGRGEQVLALRRSFQDAMAPEFRSVVEAAVGRRVVAFMSQAHLQPDIATEIFFLEPLSADGDGSGPHEVDAAE